MNRVSLWAFALMASTVNMSSAIAEELDPKQLLNLSLAQLTNLEVTSVSKRSEKASEAAAAVYVITQDDLRRSGATSIPEALRMVPGLNVARAGSHDWAIAARGSNNQFSNKLLVLIDGRSVYTPLFSGVWWSIQDTALEDIERIEVIRGPGGTLWGANAVNGVINIITKHAKDTQGNLASLTAGNEERGLITYRHGTKIGENSYARAYAKYTDRDEAYALAGQRVDDSWRKKQSGFRTDLSLTEADSLTAQGDIYISYEDTILNIPSFSSPPTVLTNDTSEARGGNFLTRWTRTLSETSNFSLQMYYDNNKRKHVFYNNRIDTFDIDFQHVLTPFDRHEFIWGAGYRSVWNNIHNTAYYSHIPENRQDDLFNAFVQDKIAIIPETFFLTLGSKFEHNDYTGFEVQPNVRASWLIDDNQTLWGAISRAVHTPNLFTDEGNLVLASHGGPPIPGFLVSAPNTQLNSETLIAYEIGYRIQPTKSLNFDLATFYNDYDKLFRGAIGTPFLQTNGPLAPYAEVPIDVFNTNSARSFGVELATNWEVASNWQLAGSYSFIDLKYKHPVDVAFSFADREPEQQFNVRSTYLFSNNWEMNNALYYVDSLSGIRIPDYWRFDTRLAWRPMEGLELSVVGQNLLDDRHPEFSGFVYQNNAEIGRSLYGSVRLNF